MCQFESIEMMKPRSMSLLQPIDSLLKMTIMMGERGVNEQGGERI